MNDRHPFHSRVFGYVRYAFLGLSLLVLVMPSLEAWAQDDSSFVSWPEAEQEAEQEAVQEAQLDSEVEDSHEGTLRVAAASDADQEPGSMEASPQESQDVPLFEALPPPTPELDVLLDPNGVESLVWREIVRLLDQFKVEPLPSVWVAVESPSKIFQDFLGMCPLAKPWTVTFKIVGEGEALLEREARKRIARALVGKGFQFHLSSFLAPLSPWKQLPDLPRGNLFDYRPLVVIKTPLMNQVEPAHSMAGLLSFSSLPSFGALFKTTLSKLSLATLPSELQLRIESIVLGQIQIFPVLVGFLCLVIVAVVGIGVWRRGVRRARKTHLKDVLPSYQEVGVFQPFLTLEQSSLSPPDLPSWTGVRGSSSLESEASQNVIQAYYRLSQLRQPYGQAPQKNLGIFQRKSLSSDLLLQYRVHPVSRIAQLP